MPLGSIINHIIGYDRMALSYALNALRQACGLCHMVFIRFISSHGSQDIRVDADVCSLGNVGFNTLIGKPLQNNVMIYVRCLWIRKGRTQ